MQNEVKEKWNEALTKANDNYTKERRIVIDPITRLEGHGKIDILLDDKGEVERAYYQIPELRGFEIFCKGRPAGRYAADYKQDMRRLPHCAPHGRYKSYR